MIKAIETKYNGYRFRSRLEARVAVLFDAMGFRYQYEPETFAITPCYGTSQAYLPDFYLPDYDIWVEVKGSTQQLRSDAGKIGDAIDFRATPISDAGLILIGQIPPRFNSYTIPAFRYLYWDKGVSAGYCSFIKTYGSKPEVIKIPSTYWHPTTFGEPVPDDVDLNPIMYPSGAIENIFRLTSIDWVSLNYIYDKARQARFEWGEKP